MPEFEDWAWRCEVYGCNAQVFREGPGPDWQEEQPYAPPDPLALSDEWEMIADCDDVVAPGCEKRPVQFVTVQSFALDPGNPDVMYIGMMVEETGGLGHTAGAYKSVDGGRTWFTAWAGLGGTSPDYCLWCRWGVTVRELYVDPLDPQVVYASTDERGSYRSTDGGAHWSPMTYSDGTPLRPGKVRRGRNGVLYHAFTSHLYRLADDGSQWDLVSVASWNRQIMDLVPDPVLPDRLWLAMGEPWEFGSGEGPILVSDDAGQTWRELGHELLGEGVRGEHLLGLAICPSDPGQMAVAAASGGIFLSIDGGETWTGAEMPDDPENGVAVAYAPLPGRCLLYASTMNPYMTWWTDDGGLTWEKLRGKVMYRMAFNSQVPEIVYALAYDAPANTMPFELWTRCYHRP